MVTAIACSIAGQTRPVRIAPASRAADLYRVPEVLEEFWCNYGVNPDYQRALESHGLISSGFGEEGETRIVELRDHPFFLATLFLPQKRSSSERPHPVLAGFAEAVRLCARAVGVSEERDAR